MTIVILDASTTVRTKIEDMLLAMDFEDLDINSFEDGDDALDFIRTNGADLIFSSIETKGMDGTSFSEHILRDNEKLKSRLFVVTSYKNDEQLEEIKEIGVKRFIPKPISEEYFKHFVIPEIDKVLNRGL